MKSLKFNFICLCFFSFISRGVAQEIVKSTLDAKGKSPADLLWETNPFYDKDKKSVSTFLKSETSNKNEFEAYRQNRADNNWVREKYIQYVWDWGTRFWKVYPDDPRRFDWLKETLLLKRPMFFNNIDQSSMDQEKGNFHTSINFKAYESWKITHDNMLEEYFNSGLNEACKIQIQFTEFQNNLTNRLQFLEYRGGTKLDLNWLRAQIIKFAPYYGLEGKLGKDRFASKGKNAVLNTIAVIDVYPQRYGLNYKDDLLPFYRSLSKISDKEIAVNANQKVELYSLLGSPFNIRHKDITGKILDTKQMKEKLIYLDFWSLQCASCIAMMPELKAIRDKYRSKGFEVVSICINPEKDSEEIIRIYRKVGADWPLLIIGGEGKGNKMGGLAKEIWDKYGFLGVPRLFLLDENRHMISYMISGRQLEETIKERLSE